MVDKKTAIIAALDSWIRQRPGLEFGNYGDWTVYRSEMRSITRDLHHARDMLRYVEWHDSITAEMILSAAQSGRLSLKVEGDNVTLDYCTGQYWSTEYRPAVCRLLSSVIWYWMCDNMPKLVTGHDIRKQASRELGTSIARRWFV